MFAPDSLRRLSTRPTALAAVLVASAVALQLARQAAVSAWDTVWAEDGAVFLRDALGGHPVTTIVEPYGGYIHLPARLAATVAAGLPLDLASIVFSLAWALVVALLAAFVFFASGEVLRSTALRLALSALVALVPAAGSELVGNATNIHFYLLYSGFWAFVWRADTTPALVARSAVVGATALGDPLTLIFAPLALWNVLTRRGARDLVVPAVFVAGLVVQFAAIAVSGEPPERLTRFHAGDILPLFALRVTGSVLVGDRFLDELWFALGRGFSYGALVVVAAALIFGARGCGRATRIFVATSSAYAVILFAAFLAGRGTAGMRPGTDEATWHLAGARFTYAPILFLSAALLAIVDCRAAHLRETRQRVLEAAAVVAVVGLIAANFALTSERSLGPSWRSEVDEGRQRCEGGLERVRIPVAPAPFGFEVEIRCPDLR